MGLTVLLDLRCSNERRSKQETSSEARPVLPGKDVFAMENRAGDIAAELNNSEIKLNSASRPFQSLKLE